MNNTNQKFGGRTKGTPNKTTAELRERFTLLLESNMDRIQSDLDTLEPKDRIRTLLEISKFIIPTLKAVDNSINPVRSDSNIKDLYNYVEFK